MPLCAGLGPRLHRVGGGGAQPLAVTHGPAAHAPLRVRAAGPGQPPGGGQALAPLPGASSGLRAPGDALGLTRGAPQARQAACCEERKAGHPGDAGRCQSDGGEATVAAPVSDGVEVGGAGAATADRLGGAPRGHGAPGLGLPDVEASGVGGADLERIGAHG
jgi:hypothetical protein